jgi:uncharacterized membrane protein YhaH (DUF805 family)
MQLVDNFKKVVLTDFANFSGRARRAEFWYFYLAYLIVAFGFVALSQISIIFWFASFFVSLALIVPVLAVATRRLHDIGKSGLMLLVAFIPVVGLILLIVWWAKDSERGSNIYGMSPKYPNG